MRYKGVRSLDFLSFLTLVIEYIVGIAKIVAVLAVFICTFMSLKCLPERMRRVIASFAQVVLFVAIFRAAVQQISLFAVRSYILIYAIANIAIFTLMLCNFIATYFDNMLSRETNGSSRLLCFCYARDGRRFDVCGEFIASDSFLQISPISLQ